jgi:hypothetical protein
MLLCCVAMVNVIIRCLSNEEISKFVWLILSNNQTSEFAQPVHECKYSAHRLIGSRIIESVSYCNQKLQAHLYPNTAQNTSVN